MRRLHEEVLPQKTKNLLGRIKEHILFTSFLFIGGTALSLRVKHRISKHLDFVCMKNSLNRVLIARFIDDLLVQGLSVEEIIPEESKLEFLEAGLNIEDYQQDFLINGVKVSFFTLGEKERLVLKEEDSSDYIGKIKIASLNTLFKTKVFALADRFKSRDVFDLYWLVKNKLFSVKDIFHVVKKYKGATVSDLIKRRLIYGKLPLTDEGYQDLLLTEEKITFEDIQKFFEEQINEYEKQQAADIYLLDLQQ
ncbi:MAG: nucleotidyl transferase AbiEii/AbiGii toxin family protein [Candidatus Desulfofervidaceae bacterium]|nr:nucleotidyl transferase AbiEii/AbiGii toxin family protein [Candidatus Desulfofervidaceae bacterium]